MIYRTQGSGRWSYSFFKKATCRIPRGRFLSSFRQRGSTPEKKNEGKSTAVTHMIIKKKKEY